LGIHAACWQLIRTQSGFAVKFVKETSFLYVFTLKILNSSKVYVFYEYTWWGNKVRELAIVCLPWQHWTKAFVWFDDVDISAFHSCVVVVVVVVVVVDLWQSLSEWHLLMSACVVVCRHENVRA